jgi:hypothetical protein
LVVTEALQKADFEKRFLELVNRSDLVITAPNIAYHLDVSIDDAQEGLIALELNGTLQQATDDKGNSYYLMPNRPQPGTLPVLASQDPASQQALQQAGPVGVQNPADAPPAPLYHNPPAKGMNINGLVLNVVLPGVGSLVCGRMNGLGMLGLAVLGLVMFFLPLGWGRLAGILPIIAGWIWSIIAGVGLLNEKEPGPGVPR